MTDERLAELKADLEKAIGDHRTLKDERDKLRAVIREHSHIVQVANIELRNPDKTAKFAETQGKVADLSTLVSDEEARRVAEAMKAEQEAADKARLAKATAEIEAEKMRLAKAEAEKASA